MDFRNGSLFEWWCISITCHSLYISCFDTNISSHDYTLFDPNFCSGITEKECLFHVCVIHSCQFILCVWLNASDVGMEKVKLLCGVTKEIWMKYGMHYHHSYGEWNTFLPTSRLDVMSLPLDSILQASNHKIHCFAAIPYTTHVFYGNSPDIRTLPEVTSHLILNLDRVYLYHRPLKKGSIVVHTPTEYI